MYEKELVDPRQARSRARAGRQGQGQNQDLAAVVVLVESIGGRYKGYMKVRRLGVRSQSAGRLGGGQGRGRGRGSELGRTDDEREARVAGTVGNGGLLIRLRAGKKKALRKLAVDGLWRARGKRRTVSSEV